MFVIIDYALANEDV